MPNWCRNVVVIRGTEDQIQQLKIAFDNNNPFATFCPVAEGQEEAVVWGTKWDPDSNNSEMDVNYGITESNEFSAEFNTAWEPPIGFYNKLVELGYNVECDFYEPNCDVLNRYENGSIMVNDAMTPANVEMLNEISNSFEGYFDDENEDEFDDEE